MHLDHRHEADWSYPLCDSFQEIGPFFLAWSAGICGTAIIQCQNKNVMDGSGGVEAYLCACLLGCYGAGYNRLKVREKYGIQSNYLFDLLAYCCVVASFSVVQEYREVKLKTRNKK